jgi:hypothetical protein
MFIFIGTTKKTEKRRAAGSWSAKSVFEAGIFGADRTGHNRG